jgi:hypothetical protein
MQARDALQRSPSVSSLDGVVGDRAVELVTQFVEAIKAVRHVERVLVTENGSEYPTVWTIIQAPSFDLAYREERLINVNEATYPVDEMFSSAPYVAYERDSGADA